MGVENLQIGKGSLYFAEFLAGTETPGPERHVGNCSEINVTSESEDLEHVSSLGGFRDVDKSVPIETTRSGSIVTDEITDDNVSVYSLGIARHVEVAALAVAATFEIAQVKPGYSFSVGTSPALPMGRRFVEVTDMKVGTAPGVELVEGVDYVVDEDQGRITILQNTTKVPAAGSEITGSFTGSAYSFNVVEAGEQKKEGQLRFVSNNPTGPQRDYLFPKVAMGPNGDLNLISEEWQTLPISLEVMVKLGMKPWYAYDRGVKNP